MVIFPETHIREARLTFSLRVSFRSFHAAFVRQKWWAAAACGEVEQREGHWRFGRSNSLICLSILWICDWCVLIGQISSYFHVFLVILTRLPLPPYERGSIFSRKVFAARNTTTTSLQGDAGGSCRRGKRLHALILMRFPLWSRLGCLTMKWPRRSAQTNLPSIGAARNVTRVKIPSWQEAEQADE